MKEINLEKTLNDVIISNYSSYTYIDKNLFIRSKYVHEAMKIAVEQAINLCAENAKLYYTDLEQTEQDIDINSILDIKKQIV